MGAEETVPGEQAQPGAASRVSSFLPKYSPPKSGSKVDRREIDRPRNAIPRLPKDVLPPESTVAPSLNTSEEAAGEGVVRLPRYDVREDRLPNFKEREILSPSARIDKYLKRHPGLRIGNFFGLNRGIAAAMIADQDAYDRRMEMQDLLGLQALAKSLPPPREDRESSNEQGTPVSAPTGQ